MIMTHLVFQTGSDYFNTLWFIFIMYMSCCYPPLDNFFFGCVFQPSDSHDKTEAVLEVSDMDGDTLDPQTGLFYRSSQPATDPDKQTPVSGGAQTASSSQAEAEQSQHTTAASIHTPPPPQLQSKPQLSQPASSSSGLPSTPPLTKKLPKLREQSQPPKPQALAQSPKDRPPSVAAQAGSKVTSPGITTKPLLTPQLPKLQQAPTSHHRPLHTAMSHPPPLQAHHPVSTEKTASSQVSVFTATSPP